jgi:CDP-diacylglycerol--serine O-phosphatidyltransferase
MKKNSLKSMIPNITTLIGLCFGVTSIRFALSEQFELSVICIVMASVCDVLDGRFSRLLKSESLLGAELDSLADFLNFGIAPSLLIYISILQGNGSIGWIDILTFIVLSCLRLARFNVDVDSKNKKYHNFFTGVPTPAGAGLVLLPLIHSFLGFTWAFETPNLTSAYVILIGLFLVSKVPTFSGKHIRFQIKKFRDLKIILSLAILIICLINSPWISLSLIGLIYILSIPLAIKAWSDINDIDKNSSDSSLEI